MEHCQCDWQGVQSDADNTEESITSSTTGRRIAKTCLCTNTNVTLNKNTNPLLASKQDIEPSILKTLPKAQRTRGLSSYHKLLYKP